MVLIKEMDCLNQLILEIYLITGKVVFLKWIKIKLNKKLNRSTLIIGDINETAESFFEDYYPAPIGAVFHDFDFFHLQRLH